MTLSTESLILQRLDEVITKLDGMRDDLHEGERRMDGFERTIDALVATDSTQAVQIKGLETKVADLEPVRQVVNKLTLLFYGAIALFALVTVLPWLKPFITK